MNRRSLYVDELSALYNRRYLKEKEIQKIKAFIARNIPFSMVIVDIDHFKEINDTHGHLKGDEIIKEFAHFLQGVLRRTDTVIRYGGDEFICVMSRTMRQDAEWVYRRILEGCRRRDFNGLQITLSVGIASYPGDGQDFEELLRVADQALYDAKRSGRDRIGIVRRKKVELPMKVFIDRIEEKEALRKWLMDKKGMSVAVVKGNVGIGKTRFGRQVLGDIKGKEIVWSDCIFFTDTIAYYPIREALKYHIKRWGKEILRDIPLVYHLEIGKLLPEVAEELKEKVDGAELVLDRHRLYESVRKIMEIGARPKIMVFDDMQWIDKESIEAIKYLFRTLKDNPVTFIFIYHNEELTDILEEFLSYIRREIEVRDIELKAFKYAEIKESVKTIIGEEPEEELVDYVVRESGGIPFSIEELMGWLLDFKYLVLEDDKWVFREPEEEIVPKTITDVAIRRYRSLSKEAQQILNIASVTGWFDIEIIKVITGYNEGEIIGLINNFSRLGMVRYTKDRFEFSEDITRNAIYKKEVEGIKALELHQKVAEKIEEHSRDKEFEVVEELAFHYYRAQQKEKGLFYCIQAGDKAREKYANLAAIKYYTWALELSKDEKEGVQRKTRIDCLLKRAETLNLIGDNEGALRDLDEGFQQSKAMGDKNREAAMILKKAHVYHDISRYKEAIEHAEKCIKVAEEIGDRKKIAASLTVIGNIHTERGAIKKAKEFYEHALTIFKEIGDKSGELTLLNNMGIVFRHLGEYSKALKFCDAALKITKEIGNRHGEAVSFCHIGNIYSTLGDHRHALKYFEDSLKIAKELGNKRQESINCGNIGCVYVDLGKYSKALKFHEDSLRMVRELGDRSGEAMYLYSIGSIYVQFGEFDKALHFCQESLRIAKGIGDKLVEAHALNRIGTVYYELGDYDNTRIFYEQAQRIFEQVQMKQETFYNLKSFARFYLTLSNKRKAKNFIDMAYAIAKESKSKKLLYDVLSLLGKFHLEEENFVMFEKTMKDIEDFGKEIKTKRSKGSLQLLLGRYNTKKKDFNRADTHLRSSLATFEELGEKLNVGEVQYCLAMLELARGDKSAFNEYLKKSLEIFNSIGAKGWEKKAEEALQEYSL